MGLLVSRLAQTAMARFFSLPVSTLHDDQSIIRFSEKSALLFVRQNCTRDVVDQVSLQTLVNMKCKSLFKPFKPIWWLAK